MRRTELIRTDYANRYHFYADVNAAKFDAIVVDLFPYQPIHLLDEGLSLEELFRAALVTVANLRADHDGKHRAWYDATLPFPRTALVPFARIIACDREQEQREHAIRMCETLAELSHDHVERVQALCRALDLLDGAPLTAPSVN